MKKRKELYLILAPQFVQKLSVPGLLTPQFAQKLLDLLIGSPQFGQKFRYLTSYFMSTLMHYLVSLYLNFLVAF